MEKIQWLFWVLPLIGILLIIFCMIAYIAKDGLRIRDKVQEFRFLGTELKISVVTFFVLVGLVLIFFWVYLSYNELLKNLKSTNETLASVNESLKGNLRQKEAEISAIRKAQNKSISFYLDLEGTGTSPVSDIRSFTAFYRTFDKDENIPLDITASGLEERNFLKITINDISVNTFITYLVIQDNQNNKWVAENFSPLTPVLNLKKK